MCGDSCVDSHYIRTMCFPSSRCLLGKTLKWILSFNCVSAAEQFRRVILFRWGEFSCEYRHLSAVTPPSDKSASLLSPRKKLVEDSHAYSDISLILAPGYTDTLVIIICTLMIIHRGLWVCDSDKLPVAKRSVGWAAANCLMAYFQPCPKGRPGCVPQGSCRTHFRKL